MALKEHLLGRPLATYEEPHERLPKRLGLAVFASDAISSTAYATEEILLILIPVAALAALDYLVPLSIVVMVVLAIVVTSYRQTIYAYPSGGGAYIVARDNLGVRTSLVAAASLLVDYSLTVAVSVSAGVAAVVSAFPALQDFRVTLAVGVVALLTVANLRGARESGTLFSVPTYLYILGLGLLVGIGLFRVYFGGLEPMPVDQEALGEVTGGREATGLVGLAGAFLLARAFSSGAVALTGTEAISNGIQAFRPPESRNAARTLIMMATILGSFFFLISVLAHHLRPVPTEAETLLSLMGGHVFGRGTPIYYFIQFATMAILFLAANTAYADFPRLSSIIAADGYLPRQLARRGDRLVFANGIVVLAAFAAVLLIAFGGVTTALIPLYAVGVFTGFTLSQAGMVNHHRRLREPNWRRALWINGVGATCTALVLAIIVVSKFTTGAWIPVVVIPALVALFLGVRRHYDRVADALRTEEGQRVPEPPRNTVIIPVASVHQGVLRALSYARSLKPEHTFAVSVVYDEEEARRLNAEWEAHGIDIELTTILSQYRELTAPILHFIDELDRQWEDDVITVLIPEFVVGHWWEHLLHNQTALVLKARLLFRRDTVVTSVPHHL
ncbi:MAG: APC family permease [Nitriliruptorales bacterium]